MAIESIPIQGIWRILRWLPSFLLRRYFTREILAQRVYVDIRPRHNSVVVDLGQTPSFSLNLQVINLSTFSVELDRASFRFWLGGVTFNASILKKQLIAPGEIATLYIGETISDGPANQIARHIDNLVALDGNIEFNCSVQSFAKTVGHLDGINPKFYNAEARKVASYE